MSHHDHAVCQGICAALDAAPASPTTRLFTLYELWKLNKPALIAALPSENEIVAFFKGLYDSRIRSIDIKLIPNAAEQMMHDVLWAALEQTIRSAVPG